MKITPVKYELQTKISSERTIVYYYEVNKFSEEMATLDFCDGISLYEIAKCIVECFKSKELKATTIKFEFHGNNISIYKNSEEVTESRILEKMAPLIR